MTTVIEMNHLTKSYGKVRGIIDLSLQVSEGDIFGFIGQNGAGKSTTIRTLLGLIKPSSGSAKILGKDCITEAKKLLTGIGYMPSEAMFYPQMRVGELIRFSAKLRKMNCDIEATNLCERFELDQKKKIEELSLGNRKKVSIVCAMQHKPSCYILDEPTSGLDPLMQKEFFMLLKERQKNGATIFLSSHVLSEIRQHCNRAAIIREGRLLVTDSVEALSHTQARKVTVKGLNTIPSISGIQSQVRLEDGFSFLYQGNMKEFIDSLHGLPITDLTISEPDIEEIFLHFYAPKEGKKERIG